MIGSPTVIVLGAGASAPMQLPIGKALLDKIVNEIQQDPMKSDLCTFCDFDSNEIDRFQRELMYSGQTSVDAFLEHRPEFLEIGKAAIAYALIKFEQLATIFNDHDRTWYKYFFGKMNSGFDDFGKNKVSFLTFNYDRTLEHFLFTALQNSYGKSEQECVAQINQIPIIHLHGSLGNLPWQGGGSRPFDTTVNRETLNVARKDIKIIHETITDSSDKDFKRGLELIMNSEQILLLGFGYNRLNMQRLGIRHALRNALGTGVGLTPAEIGDIRSASEHKIDIQQNVDCLSLLRSRSWA